MVDDVFLLKISSWACLLGSGLKFIFHWKAHHLFDLNHCLTRLLFSSYFEQQRKEKCHPQIILDLVSFSLVLVPIYWTWTKSTPPKNRFFWLNPYKIEVAITSFIEMLELPNLFTWSHLQYNLSHVINFC